MGIRLCNGAIAGCPWGDDLLQFAFSMGMPYSLITASEMVLPRPGFSGTVQAAALSSHVQNSSLYIL